MSSALVQDFRAAAARGGSLTMAELLALHGRASWAVLLLLASLLSVMPVAGVGTALGLLIVAVSWRWPHPGAPRQVSLPERLRQARLNEAWSRRSLHALAWLYERAQARLRRRWRLWRHPVVWRWWQLWIAAMGALIMLPLPLGNVLPALSLVLFSLGWMYRDGLALALSTVAGAAAFGFAWFTADVLWQTALGLGRWLGLA